MSTNPRIAGGRKPQDGMHVDYADVLAQAVENERWRVLRAVNEAIAQVAVMQPIRNRSYGEESIDGASVKRSILAAVRQIEVTS